MQRLAVIAVALAIAHGAFGTAVVPPQIQQITLTDGAANTFGRVSPGLVDPHTITSDPSRTLVAPLSLTEQGGSPLQFTVTAVPTPGTNPATGTFQPSTSYGLYVVPCVNVPTAACSCVLPQLTANPITPYDPTPTTVPVTIPGIVATSNAAGTTIVFTSPGAPGQGMNIPLYAFGQTFNFLDQPGKICLQQATPANSNPPAPIDTGVLFRIAPNCALAGSTFCPALTLAQIAALDFANATQKAEVEGRTTMCVAPQPTVALNAQCECYDPLTTIQCCIGSGFATTYDSVRYKCCADGSVVRIGDRCRCARVTVTAGTNISTSCPVNEPYCCLPSKYPELSLPTDIGFCYNPSIHQCCNTGWAYDPGAQQCCSINGVQSLNVPCPCSNNTHCVGGQIGAVSNPNHVCCKQSAPPLNEIEVCTAYANFPNGTGPYQSQRCSGTCVDLTYQLCCNGVSCSAQFEKCCNATCCNRFVGTCINSHISGYRQFQPGFGANWLNTWANPLINTGINAQPILFQTCSETEQMDPLKAFWLFIFPAALLALTLTTLALSLVFANKAAQRLFSFTERLIIWFSIIICILIIPLYFSPLYKYGLFIVLLADWSIIVASLRVRWINTVAIIGYIVLLIYLFDPFAGSAFFNLTYFRNRFGTADFTANGIWHGTKRLYYDMRPPHDDLGRCVRYFDYFLYDQEAVDYRFNSPRIFTFGYCADEYLLALYLFQGFIIIVAFILFVLLLIARVLRFRKISAAPIELEVRTDVM